MLSNTLQIAMEAAREAGALQIAGLGRKHEIEFKGEINIVTDVDKACEKAIIDRIQGAFPDHDFLAEEGGGKRKDSEYKWIVDPLDGTTNYAHSYPLFCVSIALEHKGQVILGVIYDPNRDEMFHAELGKGSFLNGKPIRVSGTSQLLTSLLVTGFAYNIKQTRRNNLNHFKNMLMTCQAVRRDGVAAIDLCYVACGRYDGFWELNLFPWDVAAGGLILMEAGGKLSNFLGGPYSVYEKEIVASNGIIHQDMVKILTKGEQETQE